MLITTEVKVKDRIREIARELAALDNEVQAEFFNEFFGAIYAEYEGHHHHQLRLIAKSLSTNSKQMLGYMYEAGA